MPPPARIKERRGPPSPCAGAKDGVWARADASAGVIACDKKSEHREELVDNAETHSDRGSEFLQACPEEDLGIAAWPGERVKRQAADDHHEHPDNSEEVSGRRGPFRIEKLKDPAGSDHLDGSGQDSQRGNSQNQPFQRRPPGHRGSPESLRTKSPLTMK